MPDHAHQPHVPGEHRVMCSNGTPPSETGMRLARAHRRAAQVIVVSSVMFTFISFWRTAAVVLCDMSSTVYYIGAIVESAIGKAAPWFILAVLLFSYGMRAVYIESCALFVRGGVYRVVKEALGGFLAKLPFRPCCSITCSPGRSAAFGRPIHRRPGAGSDRPLHRAFELDEGTQHAIKSWGSVADRLRGHDLLLPPEPARHSRIERQGAEDHDRHDRHGRRHAGLERRHAGREGPGQSDCRLAARSEQEGRDRRRRHKPVPKINPVTGEQEDPLGFLGRFRQRSPSRCAIRPSWLSLIGVVGIVIAFGHSILAMSGEETLAQVYREVESPKLPNFKKAAFIVFVYSLLLTGSMNFLAVLLIPDDQRMNEYYDNWMGGLAMHMLGPVSLLLLLNAFVVFVGFLILVRRGQHLDHRLQRRAQPRGRRRRAARLVSEAASAATARHYRLLWLITGLQLFTIVVSRGDVILLGEAYAFGVVWSFVFKTLSMVVLRFKDRTAARVHGAASTSASAAMSMCRSAWADLV